MSSASALSSAAAQTRAHCAANQMPVSEFSDTRQQPPRSVLEPATPVCILCIPRGCMYLLSSTPCEDSHHSRTILGDASMRVWPWWPWPVKRDVDRTKSLIWPGCSPLASTGPIRHCLSAKNTRDCRKDRSNGVQTEAVVLPPDLGKTPAQQVFLRSELPSPLMKGPLTRVEEASQVARRTTSR